MGYIQYHVFSQKEMSKDYRELIELHKRCIKTYLVSKSIEYPTRKKFFIVYDHLINEANIKKYFYLPVVFFVYSLVVHGLQNLDKTKFPDGRTIKRERRHRRRLSKG